MGSELCDHGIGIRRIIRLIFQLGEYQTTISLNQIFV